MKYDFGKLVKRLTMLVCLIIGIAIIIFLMLDFCGKKALDFYYSTSTHIIETQKPYLASLQEYIDANRLSLADCDQLSNWVKDNKPQYLTISREGELLYGVTYVNGFVLSVDAYENLHRSWLYFRTVSFQDGDADAFIYDGSSDKYYKIITVLCALVAILISVLLLFHFLHRIIYNQQQQLELAKEQEKALLQSRNELIQHMAHDLRTPLTGLIAFAEIVKLENRKQAVDEKHIDKILEKANEIKNLTDRLFDVSLLSGNLKDKTLCHAETVQNMLEDYLSDFSTILTKQEFMVNADSIRLEEVMISANTELLGRIFNNLISNIIKYGKQGGMVRLSTDYLQNTVSVLIQNEIGEAKNIINSSGIGLKSVQEMMLCMGGRAEVRKEKDMFTVCLRFPVQKWQHRE